MTSRIANQLSKLPLWRRDIPRPPLYYKGDEKRREFLPLYWMKMIPPAIKMPEYMVSFIVHPQMNKHDIKQYLEKIYKVPVLHVRTELRVKEIKANSFKKGKITTEKFAITTEEEKYAYVHLAEDTFTYPTYFKLGGKGDVSEKIELKEKFDKEEEKYLKTRQSDQGLPIWFTGFKGVHKRVEKKSEEVNNEKEDKKE